MQPSIAHTWRTKTATWLRDSSASSSIPAANRTRRCSRSRASRTAAKLTTPPIIPTPIFRRSCRPSAMLIPNAVVDPDNVGHPAGQLLNITALFPARDARDWSAAGHSGRRAAGSVDLAPVHRNHRTDFLFEAFLYITQPGVHFQANFFAEYDLEVLEGVPESLGCHAGSERPDRLGTSSRTCRSSMSRPDINGDNEPEFVDTITNSGCINPTRTLQKGISAVPYYLALNPDTYGFTFLDPSEKSVTEGNDAVFVRLVQSLYDDLEFVRRELACIAVDNPTAAAADHRRRSATRSRANGRTARSSSTSASPRHSCRSKAPPNENCQCGTDTDRSTTSPRFRERLPCATSRIASAISGCGRM